MTTKKHFPISYFAYSMTPKAIFSHLDSFRWWQNFLLIVFLNALIMIPVTLHYAQLKTYSVEKIVNRALDPITDKTFLAFSQGEITANRYQGNSQLIRDGQVALAVLPSPQEKERLKAKKLRHIILTEKRWIFVTPEGKMMTAQVSGKEMSLKQFKDVKAVKQFINDQWYQSNKASLLAYLLLSFSLLIYFATFLVIGLGTLFLSLSRKSRLFDIKSYSECFGLMVNCFALPTLVSVGISLFASNPLFVMHTQVFGTLLMLTLVFYKTHFRDDIRAY
ncbi:DUF1189 family protein [Streptococcus iniae]|uniref:DUF1189 family protein n=1 Tax=Streptococcus iniae TaxID=1346 RepID=UPI00273D36AE|nr:DUF1189 family protein [Streptococcus iniae]WLR88430.1 maltodextrose utilization protein malA [Streptococcus iniae]WLR89197.1 maltodextrose utilization protein malA [Streptococcus iniae]